MNIIGRQRLLWFYEISSFFRKEAEVRIIVLSTYSQVMSGLNVLIQKPPKPLVYPRIEFLSGLQAVFAIQGGISYFS